MTPPDTGAPVPAGASLSRRMIGLAAAWIFLLLSIGGFALDRILTNALSKSFDDQMNYLLTAMIASAENGPDGEVLLNRALGDQRFLEPNSGLYFQVSGKGYEPFRSRSLWDESLTSPPPHTDTQPHFRDTVQLGQRLRVVERTVILPQSPVRWHFQVAQARDTLDAQINTLRRTLVRSFALLALGLIAMAGLQTLYGLWPLRGLRRDLQTMREGKASRVETRELPREIAPLAGELNALVAHTEQQAEEARTHAGNLAHALKTPLTVVANAAQAGAPDLPQTVLRETATMQRQIDHHLARARALGRRSAGQARTEVWHSVVSVTRAMARLYPAVRFDQDGAQDKAVRVERQDLDEMLGNLVENAAKYGGGSVFVTVRQGAGVICIDVEDDGPGVPAAQRERLFDRGTRLDSTKPGTGLGLAIVRDVAEIYGGSITLGDSEDLGGLLASLTLPAAAALAHAGAAG